ncbi:LytR/AlgR family response regulator transcription factor [Terrimonas sp.]|uniref:LytR/AlgR family response regulator transcription factor n=1 Tax=Terrimonas sp. TaxID=1914338 RepID=UPI001402FB46|nr:LytTR family DNA-binding domain-containing protein [Terrimonas sp.]
MLNCIIVEDEQQSIDILIGMLKESFGTDLHIIASYKTVETAIIAIREYKPELLFLDVQIGNQTGFDLLKQLDTKDIKVIFITAFEKYAIQAFRFSAIDYLLKPVSTADLHRAVSKVLNLKYESGSYKKIETLLKNIYNKDRQKLCIPDINGFNIVEINDIIRCESNINYTTIYINKSNPITVAKSLKEFEKMLSDFNFFRVHNSHLVNLNYIKSYNKSRGGYVELTNGEQIEISIRRKDEFIKTITRV